MADAKDAIVGKRGPMRDEWFERREDVPMSKEPVRALVLSLLAPLVGARVLEIGTGSGGMTVELLRAVGERGRVVTLEVSQRAASLAEANVERAGLGKCADMICGSAPKQIPLQAFDAVFVGGHGGELEKIVGTCWDRLEPGGRLLLTAIMPGTTTRALTYLDGLGAEIGFWRVAPAVGRRVGGDWLLSAHNPIDLIWGDK